MTPFFRSFLLLLLVCLLAFSGEVRSIQDAKTGFQPSEDMRGVRKLKVVDVVLDYDYGGANQKHDPRKGRGGNGSKVP